MKNTFTSALKFPVYPMDKFVIAITGYNKKPRFYRSWKCFKADWTLDLNKAEIFDGNCYYNIKEKCMEMLRPNKLPKGYEWHHLKEVKVTHIAKVTLIKKINK